MASLNKVMLIGNLGRDPEVRQLPGGASVTNISVATSSSWKDKSGEKKETVEWHRIVFFGKLAEIAGQYLAKGSQVYVEGELRTKKWTDKDGAEKLTVEIVAQSMTMLGSRAQPSGEQRSGNTAAAPKAGNSFDDDDIPY